MKLSFLSGWNSSLLCCQEGEGRNVNCRILTASETDFQQILLSPILTVTSRGTWCLWGSSRQLSCFWTFTANLGFSFPGFDKSVSTCPSVFKFCFCIISFTIFLVYYLSMYTNIYIILVFSWAAPGLPCCMGSFIAESGACFLVVVCRLLTAVASLVVGSRVSSCQ